MAYLLLLLLLSWTLCCIFHFRYHKNKSRKILTRLTQFWIFHFKSSKCYFQIWKLRNYNCEGPESVRSGIFFTLIARVSGPSPAVTWQINSQQTKIRYKFHLLLGSLLQDLKMFRNLHQRFVVLQVSVHHHLTVDFHPQDRQNWKNWNERWVLVFLERPTMTV